LSILTLFFFALRLFYFKLHESAKYVRVTCVPRSRTPA
jgi:hypothetical protein